MNLVDLMNLKGFSLNQLGLLGMSASPFIDEGDGLTSERKRMHVLLSLVAHTGGVGVHRMMVGVHNTVECQMHVRGLCCLLRIWQTSAPATLLIPRGM